MKVQLQKCERSVSLSCMHLGTLPTFTPTSALTLRCACSRLCFRSCFQASGPAGGGDPLTFEARPNLPLVRRMVLVTLEELVDRGRTVGEKLQHFFATKLKDDQVGVGGERWGGEARQWRTWMWLAASSAAHLL